MKKAVPFLVLAIAVILIVLFLVKGKGDEKEMVYESEILKNAGVTEFTLQYSGSSSGGHEFYIYGIEKGKWVLTVKEQETFNSKEKVKKYKADEEGMLKLYTIFNENDLEHSKEREGERIYVLDGATATVSVTSDGKRIWVHESEMPEDEHKYLGEIWSVMKEYIR